MKYIRAIYTHTKRLTKITCYSIKRSPHFTFIKIIENTSCRHYTLDIQIHFKIKSMIHVLYSVTETNEKTKSFITLITSLGFCVTTTLQVPESLDFIRNIINLIVGNIKFLKIIQVK